MDATGKIFSPGDWILQIRTDLLKMNRDRFSMLLGVNVSQVFKWEKNKNPMSKTAKYLFLDQIKLELQKQNYDWSDLPNDCDWESWVENDYKLSRGWSRVEERYEPPELDENVINKKSKKDIISTDFIKTRKTFKHENPKKNNIVKEKKNDDKEIITINKIYSELKTIKKKFIRKIYEHQ